MSFMCVATKEHVIGERCVQVPIKIRKVIYIAQTKPDSQSDFLKFAGQSEGWEIVETAPVRQSSAEVFAMIHPPEMVGEKEVRFMLPNKPYERFVRRDRDTSNDKPESL